MAKRRRVRPHPSSSSTSGSAYAVEYRIDLHRMTVAQALDAVERHLVRNYAARSPWVVIVHGRGTGALRDAIQDALSHDKRVKRFNFAPPNMGGDGATIAELRY